MKYDVLKLSPEKQEEMRFKTVRQMKKHGDTKEVAEICECSQHEKNTMKAE